MSERITRIQSDRSALAAFIAALPIVAIIAVVPTWTHAQEPATKMEHSKMDNMKNVEDTSKTGDVDYDFAANMRKHHQMAIDMSQAELKNGKNPKMLGMAKDIVAAQQKEIAEFDRWMEEHKKAMPGSMPK